MLSAWAHMRSGAALSALGHAVIAAAVLGLFANPKLFQSTSEPIKVEIVASKDAPQFDAPDFGIELAKSGKKETKGSAGNKETEQSPKTDSPSDTQSASANSPAPSPRQSNPQITQPGKPGPQVTQTERPVAPTEVEAPKPEPPGQVTFSPAPAPPRSVFAPTKIPELLDLVTPETSSGLAPLAEVPADIAADDVSTFKAHLRKCIGPPSGVSADPKFKLVLRVFLARNGALAQQPVLMAATASPAGPTLVQTATAALRRCAPFDFLPADRYKEWKVLDVSLSAADMGG